MKRSVATAGLIALGVFIVGSLGWDAAQMVAAAGPTKTAPATSVQNGPVHIYLTIATPDMLGTTVGPAYLPSDFTVPADTAVTITVTNFDDATALPPGSQQYATATGITGPLSIQPLDPANPNGAAPPTTAYKLDPATGVSHTFTIAKLGLNVPMAPHAKTTFTFRTGAAGTYTWQCMDPCGSGDSGWQGAMDTKGYMTGQLTVA